MKKLFTIFSALALFTSANAAVGDEFNIDGVTYSVTSDNEVEIKKVDSSLTSVSLSSVVENDGSQFKVVGVGERAFYWGSVTSVTLPSTVKYIGYYAFGSSSIAEINMPEGLDSIADYAFYGCKSLAKVVLPEGLKEMGPKNGSVFGTCYKLSEITFPSTLNYICKSAFYNCKALKSVVIPEGVKEIRRVAFNTCGALESVTLPESLEELGDGAFGDCKVLKEINGSLKNVKSIGEECFFNCPITTFAIPDALETIGARAFSGSSIANFTIGANQNFTIDSDALYTADKSLLVAFPPKSERTEIVVADGCRGINGGAFQLSGIKNVTLPASVIALDDFAFCQSALESISFTDNLVYIGQQAFAATNITSMELPQGLRILQDAVFAGCGKLTSVTVKSNVTDFGIRQFYQCTALKEVHFKGANVPVVGYWEYSSESPFYGIANKQVTLYCPKGLADAYKSEYSFDAIGAYVDSEPAIFVPTSITPANNSEVQTLDRLTFNFATDATVVVSNPAIKVICGKTVAGVPMGDEISVGMWSVLTSSDKKAPYIVPLDEYGEGGEPINMEVGKEYYVTIPAGVFKDAEGALNEEITLHYIGTWVEPVFMPVSITPADGSEIDEIGNIYLEFESKVSKAWNADTKIKVIVGSLIDGVPVGDATMGNADQWWINLDGTKAQIYPADYDAYIMPIALEEGKDYFFVVSQGAFRNADYVYNKDIIVHYSKKTSGVSVVEEAEAYVVKSGDSLDVHVSGNSDVTVYSASGMLIDSATSVQDVASFSGLSHGLYIMKITTGKNSKVIKVMM